jgi:hypothetical protein
LLTERLTLESAFRPDRYKQVRGSSLIPDILALNRLLGLCDQE